MCVTVWLLVVLSQIALSVANTCVSDFSDLPLSRKLVYMCVHPLGIDYCMLIMYVKICTPCVVTSSINYV